jgi:serine/threonine protein kinase
MFTLGGIPSAAATHKTDMRTEVILRRDAPKEPSAPITPPVATTRNFSPTNEQLGHFDVLETIDEGGCSIVVQAFDRKLRRMVAIKILSAEMAATSPARRRFVRKARAGAAVRPEHVAQIYAIEEQAAPYLVMEYAPGGSLQELLNRTGPLEVREVLRLAAHIARGQAAAKRPSPAMD